MMQKVPIHHFITELSAGGAQMALYRLLKNLNQDRYRPAVSCLYNGDQDVAERIRALDIPVTDLGMAAKYRADAFIRFMNLLRHQRPAILHTWLFHANVPGRVLGRMAGVPIIISSERTMEMESALRLRLNRMTARYADQITCVSVNVASYAEHIIGIQKSKIVVIPNGIEMDLLQSYSSAGVRKELGLREETAIVASVGRLESVKGHRFLLEAWAKIVPRNSSTKLLIIGSGTEQQSLEEQVKILGIESEVTFMGNRTDVPQLLIDVDIVALPSLAEGLPNVALEAMLAGKPVVATNVGGIPEVVVDGQTGILVSPRDPEALALAIDRLLCSPDLRKQMGECGRVRVNEDFDISKTVIKTEAMYESLLRDMHSFSRI